MTTAYSCPASFLVRSISYKPSPITWGSRIHCHSSHEFCFIVSGEGYFTDNTHTIEVHAGDMTLTPSRQYHCLYPSAGGDLTYAAINFQVTQPGFFAKELQRPNISLRKSGEYASYIRQMILCLLATRRDSPSSSLEAALSLTDAILVLAEWLFTKGSQPILHNAVFHENMNLAHQIFHYINSHYLEPVSLESLGQRFHISPSHLSHIFQAEFGISPIYLVLQSRLIYSTTLLITTTLTIDEIAQRAGFSTTTNYLRQFKKHIGNTPTDFRRENQFNLTVFRPEL
ncbi:MAG: AraC family transcriptional regulator [Lachnospiraceae bacterium]|nr:AraC family transcriptional regulator [Lachnospiraceae bacterium]